MTVVMACTFPGGACIAADSLFHNAETGNYVKSASKMVAINAHVAVAAAGRFSGTEPIWNALQAVDPNTADPTTISALIRAVGQPVFEKLKKADPSVQMRYLVAGIEKDGQSSVHWLQFDVPQFAKAHGPSNIIALGTLPDTNEVAKQAMLNSLLPAKNIVQLDVWCQEIVSAEAKLSPKYVGFPAQLVLLRSVGDGLVVELTASTPANPQLQVFWP